MRIFSKFLLRQSWVVLGLATLTWALPAHALVMELPESLAPELLSETVPFVISPGDLSAQDYQLEWLDTPIEGVGFSIASNSFEWVRIKDILVLPRGRAVIVAKDLEAGEVSHWDYRQSFSVDSADKSALRAEIPIALFSGKENPIEIKIKRKGRVFQSKLIVRFKPSSPERENRALFDPSCSPFNVEASDLNLPKNSYVFVGCRLAYVWGEEHLTSSLELYVFWDGVGQMAKVDGLDRATSSVNVFALRQRAAPGSVRFEKDGGHFTLTYQVPDRQHWGYLGVGLGPYSYVYNDTVSQTYTYAPLLTLYSGFIFTEAMRIVAFNATALHSKYYSDLGVYLLTEQARFLDKRVSLNILLGGHALFYRNGEQSQLKFSGPQGVEVVWRDFLQRRYNLSFGSFIYPKIDGQSYYNVWLRWGHPGFFGEINFISWTETDDVGEVFHRSLGVTVGMPLARFF